MADEYEQRAKAPSVEITKHCDIVIDGEHGLHVDSIVRCFNKNCDRYGEITLSEAPDVCCDGPFAVYTLHHVEMNNDGRVLAVAPPTPAHTAALRDATQRGHEAGAVECERRADFEDAAYGAGSDLAETLRQTAERIRALPTTEAHRHD